MGKKVEHELRTPATDAQRKAHALLRDIAAAGDDGVAIGNLIFGPQRETPGGTVMNALRGLEEAGVIHHTAGAWHPTYLGLVAVEKDA